MIEKIEGIIKLKNGNRHYLSMSEFINFLEMLRKENIVPTHISMNPFYKHKDFLLEVDERMFYIESRKKISEDDVKRFYEESIIEENLFNIDLDKRIFLIEKSNKEEFSKCIDKIIDYIPTLVSYILEQVKKDFSVDEKSLCYGNVSFEIYYE